MTGRDFTSPPSASATANLGWRTQPGYLNPGGSDFESIHILIGKFLADRDSVDKLKDRSLLRENQHFEWGAAPPLEKVIDSETAFYTLLTQPKLYRNAIAIIEPWKHVGKNAKGEEVRASVNIAYFAQKIADCDSIVFPVWDSGVPNLDQWIPMISSGLAIVVEGGHPSARDPATFDGSKSSHPDLIQMTEEILLSRSPTSAPAIFICLGHQLAAQGHISLIYKAVKQVLGTEKIAGDDHGKALKALKRVCQSIQDMGESLVIQKYQDTVIAKGWTDKEFAVAANEIKEVGHRQLLHYKSPDHASTEIPEAIIAAHEITADTHEGVIDTSIQYECALNIAMFHSDEVNEESILFANWAYRLIHDALIPCRHMIANSILSWLIRLPDAVEILCSTESNGEIVTECSATCINYIDFETKQVRRSFTCQFHPELLADLREIGKRDIAPSYADLKQDDGARLFARLLYAGMQE